MLTLASLQLPGWLMLTTLLGLGFAMITLVIFDACRMTTDDPER